MGWKGSREEWGGESAEPDATVVSGGEMVRWKEICLRDRQTLRISHYT